MTEEPDPDNPQPNNPDFENWYNTLLCPWDLNVCGQEPLGKNGDENHGVPTEWSGAAQNLHYLDEPGRRTMSCGLCGRLKQALGAPPFMIATDPAVLSDPEFGRNWYFSKWDMHPFGAWLANEQRAQGWALDETVAKINQFRASNGEEMHGFAWQSTRLLALDANGVRRTDVDFSQGDGFTAAPKHLRSICDTTWGLSTQSRDDCWHGAGHGAHGPARARALRASCHRLLPSRRTLTARLRLFIPCATQAPPTTFARLMPLLLLHGHRARDEGVLVGGVGAQRARVADGQGAPQDALALRLGHLPLGGQHDLDRRLPPDRYRGPHGRGVALQGAARVGRRRRLLCSLRRGPRHGPGGRQGAD
eukprot:3602761-Prymnesium_polylepis.1